MKIIPIKQSDHLDQNVGTPMPGGGRDGGSKIRTPLYPPRNEATFLNTEKQRCASQHITLESPEKHDLRGKPDHKQNGKFLQRQWKLLRKLNNRYRKKVCRRQRLIDDINRLQKQIRETSQKIANLSTSHLKKKIAPTDKA